MCTEISGLAHPRLAPVHPDRATKSASHDRPRIGMTIPVEQAAINLAVALGLSAAIGFERQWRNRLAGLRTNTLVALGAATFVIFATLVPGDASPTRVAAQVVSGIGFLGAGLIFREGLSVRGLNTSATLWCSAAIGVLAGRAGQTRHHPGGCADVPPGLGDPVRRHLSDRQGPPPTCPGFGHAQSQVANHARLGHQRQGAHALHELVFDGPDPPQVHKDFWKAAYAALAP